MYLGCYPVDAVKERMKLIRDPEGLIRCGAYLEKQRREEYGKREEKNR